MIDAAVDSILILIIVLLPGGLSITVTRLYHPSVSDKSTLIEWSMLLYHATIAHLISVMLPTIIMSCWQSVTESTLKIEVFLADDLTQPSDDVLLPKIVGYVVLLVVASVLSGIFDFPSMVTRGIAWVFGQGKGERKPLYDEPIWYKSLSVEREAAGFSNVVVRARMKNGDVYIGSLDYYAISADSDNAKDLVLKGPVRYSRNGSEDYTLLPLGDEGGVLLNSSNISSLEYLYHNADPAEEEEV